MINKLEDLGFDDHINTSALKEPLIMSSNNVMDKVMELFVESKNNIEKINKNLEVLEKMKNMAEYSTEQKTDKYISLSMKKILKNNLLFIE